MVTETRLKAQRLSTGSENASISVAGRFRPYIQKRLSLASSVTVSAPWRGTPARSTFGFGWKGEPGWKSSSHAAQYLGIYKSIQRL